MPTPVLCAPTQACSQGARKTGLVAGDSTGPGAIQQTVGVSIPPGASACWIFTAEGLVGSEQSHGVGQDPVTVSLQGCAGPSCAAGRGDSLGRTTETVQGAHHVVLELPGRP